MSVISASTRGTFGQLRNLVAPVHPAYGVFATGAGAFVTQQFRSVITLGIFTLSEALVRGARCATE